ncbi:hypothetical protein [Winogradskyella poriferorum]|uniref:hypothetical protein n=1 Tax=Winogradskyella poriferorum TaxID=307627 RepID=UPI003D651455
MKKTLIIFLILPFVAFAQSAKGYFDISKDAFYHEKMSSWKKYTYKDVDCKFNTIVDNDSVFTFSAQNKFFQEDYKLTLNKQKKITKIEVFFTVHNGKLDEWFPYKYPINISNLFKDVGTPSETKENISYKPKYGADVSDYLFKKYYKWNNGLFRETKIELEVANGTTKLPVKNKRGKIKSYRTVDFGYMAYTPKGQGTLTENDINFNVSSKISDGAKKIWIKNKRELISLLGLEKFDASNSWVDGQLHPYLFYLEATNDPEEYFKKFFFHANIVYGIEFGDEGLEENQKYTYTSLPDGVLARAIGMDKECCIEILIDLENWNKSTYIDKLFIMYHEFGHDVFELEHSDGIRLMTTNKLDIDGPSVLGEMIHEMFIAVLKKQKGK